MAIKKKLCNPPVEQVAAHGDPELLGLFMGAGAAVNGGDIKDKDVLKKYVHEVTECEAGYLRERKELAARHTAEMRRLESWLLEQVGEGY